MDCPLVGQSYLIMKKGSEIVLNKPKFMRPSMNKEECTIDITPLYKDTSDGVPFSCIVDGNEAIVAWQIIIYDINDDKKVYDTGEIPLDPSFYPVDEKNRNVVFTKDISQYPNIITENSSTEKINSFVNREDPYYWTITFVGSSENKVTSYQEVFYANETPDIKFFYNGNDLDKFRCYGTLDIAITDASSFEFEAETGTINKYTGTDANVVIPYEINGIKVTNIGGSAFSECSTLKNIIIPASVTNIGNSAFEFTGLTDVYFSGTEEQWNSIVVGKCNDILLTANIQCDIDIGAEILPVLTSRDCTFKAMLNFGYDETGYKSQLKRYGWKITDTDTGQVLVDTITKNNIYGSADNIICRYDGFLSGGNYCIELYIETQNNTKITSSFKFSVSYITTFLSNDFKVDTLKNEPAVMLDWREALVIAGILQDENNSVVAVEDTTFKTNYPVDNQCSIEIPDKYKVVYSDDESLNFDIDENSYMAFSTQLLSSNKATLFFAEGVAQRVDDDGGYYKISRELSYNNKVFTYNIKHDGVIVAKATCAVQNRPSEYVWYNIFMPPLTNMEEFNVYESRVVNCIYPSKNLYPSKDFYPTFGNWTNLKEG